MNDEERAGAAAALLEAYETGKAIEPLSLAHPAMTIDDAYAVQMHQVARWCGDGRLVKGHKVGLTSAAMQAQLGVGQPDFGHLFHDMFLPGGRPVAAGRFIQPRVEPEIALVLRRGLRGPGVTLADAVAATDFVLPSLEIIDSRIRDWRITITDTIADNASSGGVVLGGRPMRPDGADLSTIGSTLRRNGDVVGTGTGAAVLGHPFEALVWLAETLGARGSGLEPGQVVLPGSMTAAVTVSAGDTVTAEFGLLGSVAVSFA